MGSNKKGVDDFKEQMKKMFDMSDLGLLSYYLGFEVKQSSKGISICQSGYAEKVLEKHGMTECKPCHVPMDARVKLSKEDGGCPVDTTLYRSMIGSLRYLVNTRPDLAYSVGVVSRYMEAPTTSHLAAVKQILRYVRGTTNYGCMYSKVLEENFNLVGYSDSDLAGDLDDRKSTTGVMYFLGDSPISWVSQKQKVVALSSCEAEYVAATAGTCQGVWIQRLLRELTGRTSERVVLRIDNKSAIALTKNPIHHDRTKHIDIKYHFIRDYVESGEIEMDFVRTEEQCADILTKPLPYGRLRDLSDKIGVVKIKPE